MFLPAPLSQKCPFLWLATIQTNNLHYEIETSKPMGIKSAHFFRWSRENMIGLVMFSSPPPHVLLTHSTVAFALLVIINSNTHLVYQQNSLIFFWSNNSYLTVICFVDDVQQDLIHFWLLLFSCALF